MPKFYLKPIIKLSKEQWKTLLTRAFEKEAKITPKVAQAAMRFEPPVEKEVGTLFRTMPVGAGEVTRTGETLPIAEARARYFSEPEKYMAPTMVEPTAKVLTPPPAGMEEAVPPGTLADLVGYERYRFRPIIPPGASKSAAQVTKAIEEQEAETGLRQLGLTAEDVRSEVPITKIAKEKGLTVGTEKPPITKIIGEAALGTAIWKEIGGARSIAGKLWDEFYRASSGGVKSTYKSGQDYFVASVYKYRLDPRSFANKHPREAALLEKIFNEESVQSLIKEIGLE